MLILVVCTANQCRSPMAAHLLQQQLPIGIVVASAGVHALEGIPATDEAISVMAARGIDLSDHRSRQVEPLVLDVAGLVLGMEAEHLRTCAHLSPDIATRAFTLPEFVERAEQVDPRRPGESIDGYRRRVHKGRSARDLFGVPEEWEIPDPIGRPLPDYEQCADRLSDLCTRFARVFLPSHRSQ